MSALPYIVGVAVRAQLREDRDEEEEMKKRKTSIIVHGLEEPAGVDHHGEPY